MPFVTALTVTKSCIIKLPLLFLSSHFHQSIVLCFSDHNRTAMGGGNGQKSRMARERNMEKNKSSKGSQLEANKKAMNIQCKVCMQTFICTTSEVKCREHAEAKHPKVDLYACFPHLKK
ncbi:hypothetical protein VNO80_16905 [Phaseolus coccineus]|uniref:Uncharacterized protein n=1 Tax=Phaseolus coccineus TaxID=3886 RepID=A0AAN9MMV6_PHACN